MSNLFAGCAALSCVTAYVPANQLGTATNKSADWLNGVASSGVFKVPDPSAYASVTRGVNTIPEGWTIEEIA